MLHEFPEGIITYLLLLKSGLSERKAMVLAFFAAALTTPPLGMLFSYPLRRRPAHSSGYCFFISLYTSEETFLITLPRVSIHSL